MWCDGHLVCLGVYQKFYKIIFDKYVLSYT